MERDEMRKSGLIGLLKRAVIRAAFATAVLLPSLADRAAAAPVSLTNPSIQTDGYGDGSLIDGKVAVQIDLRPSMPAISNPGVPALSEVVSNADLLHSPMSILPSTPYQWVCDTGQIFQCMVSAVATTGIQRCVLTVWDWTLAPVKQLVWNVPFQTTTVFNVAGRGTYMLTLDAQLRQSRRRRRTIRERSETNHKVKNLGASPEAFQNMNSEDHRTKPKQASGYPTQRE
jgi:hypothetical protein